MEVVVLRGKRLLIICVIVPVMLAAVALAALISADSSWDNGSREAVLGKLSLTASDLELEDGIKLNGQWEFYNGQLLEPQDFARGAVDQGSYIEVPSSWEGAVIDGETLTNRGYATYRLTVQLPPQSPALGLETRMVTSAHRLWINGELTAENGIVGTSRDEATPLVVPRLVRLDSTAGEVEIVMQVSNFTQRKAGVLAPAVIGDYNGLERQMKQKLVTESILSGCIVIMGLYHMVLFLLLRRNSESLLFGLICILLAMKNSSHGEMSLAVFFQHITDNVLIKVEYIGFLGSTPMFVLFICYSFPGQMPRWLCRLLWIPGVLFTLFILVSPVYVFTELAVFFQIYAVITGVILLQYIFRAAIKGRAGGRLMAMGAIVFFITVVNDILRSNGTVKTGIYFPYGLLFLIICLSIILSMKFSRAFKTIERLSARLLDLDKVKDEFLANTSHELRTPLNGMVGLAQSLLYNAKDKLDASQVLHLNMIISSGQRMAYLINDILDYSRLANNDIRLNMVSVDLHQLVQVVLTIVKPLTEGRDLLMSNEVPPDFPAIEADENRLQQIIFNLIGNAIKYTPAGKVIIGAVQRNEVVEIYVMDTGIGIPESEYETIFKPFEQFGDQNETGSGLGLKITKQLVELHKGNITLHSQVGVGSRFSFTIPKHAIQRQHQTQPKLAARNAVKEVIAYGKDEIAAGNDAVARQAANHSGDNPPAKPYRLLVVDDEPVNLQVVIQQLSSLHCIVDTAASGEQVAARVKDLQQYDLVIADLMMTGMSGYELCQLIRRSYTLYDLPILIMTASNREDTLVAGFNAGANDYISKPFGRNELFSRVRTLILLKRAVQEVSLNADELASLNSQLTELNASLERRIQERTVELGQTNEVLEHRNKELHRLELARRRLLSDVSHELRTPMTAIQGYVEAIVSGLVDDEKLKKRYLQMVLSKALGLNRLIQDLFELSRLESRRTEMVFEITPLDKLVAYIKEKFMLDTLQAGLKYHFHVSFDVRLLPVYQVIIDLDRINQVLTNLVFNAIQHTAPGGEIRISCDIVEKDISDESEGEFVIHVQDTGSGIHQDSLPLVFDRFYREPNKEQASGHQGSGIGLAIAKEIVQYHDGLIEVTSVVGQGSTFSFTLPLYKFD
ncbi:response regulator [Paenibacillaceae bacterium]|nr:response regulator [Paenibacillaceae bacterium]